MGHFDTRFLEVRAATVRTLFDVPSYHVDYGGCPWPPSKSVSAELRLMGNAFPRGIVVTETTECDVPEAMPKEEVDPCTPSTSTSTWSFGGDGYHAGPASKPSASTSASASSK